jgi:fibronectin-binding autotransporter adhesin
VAGDVSTFLSLGYDFKVGRLAFGPVISGQYTYMGFSSFTENGAESLNLRVGGQSYNSMRMNVGGRIAYTWPINQKVLFIPEVRMFWQHEFLQNPTDINASLNGAGPGFTYRTSVAGRDSVFAGAGLNLQIGRQWMMGAHYNVDFASRTSIDNIVSVNLAYSF